MGQLVVLNECTCPGHELRLECTVVGGGVTLWRGSAFDCTSKQNSIALRHSQFENRTVMEMCNDGAVIGHSIGKTSVGLDFEFTSQLIIRLDVDATLDGRTVECAYDNNTDDILIGSHIIVYTRGIRITPCVTNVYYMIICHILQLHLPIVSVWMKLIYTDYTFTGIQYHLSVLLLNTRSLQQTVVCVPMLHSTHLSLVSLMIK